MILIGHTPRLKADNYLHSLIVVVDDITDAKTTIEQFL
jgi:hypoxanthine phosphoribosyltransferase